MLTYLFIIYNCYTFRWSGAAAWLVGVPVGGTWVAVGHGEVSLS